MKSICLIGFMGSGKTTVGKLLHEKLQMDFYDTDIEIERQYKKLIPQIFEDEGEKVFREYETVILKKMPTEDAIVSTGGGMIAKAENRLYMKENFFVVYLNPNFETISTRLMGDHNRPLWNQDVKNKQHLYEKRKNYYLECANLEIKIKESTTPEEIVNYIISAY